MEKEICAICGSGDTAPLFGTDDRIYRCLRCGTSALAKRMRIEDLDEYYGSNQVYSLNAESKDKVRTMTRVANEYLDILTPHIAPANKRFLDIGANHGALVEAARKRGFIAAGLEKNKLLVEDAKGRGLDLSDEDIGTYLRREKPDAIAIMHVLEHLPDPRETVKEIHAALPPGGLLLVEVPNIESYLAKRHKLSWKYVVREHLTYFSPGTLADLLKQEGFEIRAAKSRNHFIDGLGLRNLLQYLFAARIERDRFFLKRASRAEEDAPPVHRGPLFKMLKRLIIKLIRMLRREDFILMLARK